MTRRMIIQDKSKEQSIINTLTLIVDPIITAQINPQDNPIDHAQPVVDLVSQPKPAKVVQRHVEANHQYSLSSHLMKS